MLAAVNLSKSIDGRKILSNIDLKINPASITALIGPSGGGKSTLLRTLSLLEDADSGSIQVDEKQYTFPLNGKAQSARIHPLVTIVFQQFHLWPHLTVKQNILMPLTELRRPVEKAEYEYLLNCFEIAELLNKFPHEISVGQKQRVAFSRAVLLKPKYLLLDEITSALDIRHIGNVLKYVQDLSSKGVSIIIATHLLGFAARVADHIVFLDSGQIVEQGNRSILTEPKTELLTKFLSYSENAG